MSIVDQIKAHPFVVAMALFIIVFVGYTIFKNKSASTSTTVPPATTSNTIDPSVFFPTDVQQATDTTPLVPASMASVPPVPPVVPPSNLPVCDVQGFNACIVAYNKQFPNHPSGAAHTHCFSLFSNCTQADVADSYNIPRK